jgi:hypothetical protein
MDGRAGAGLVGFAAAARPALLPVPVPATRFRDPIASAKANRTAELAESDWSQAVDAALEGWDQPWDELLESPCAA